MKFVIFLLILISISLLVDENDKVTKSNIRIRLFRFAFCISVSYLLPTMVENGFNNYSDYANAEYNMIIIYTCTIITTVGLQFIVFDKFKDNK